MFFILLKLYINDAMMYICSLVILTKYITIILSVNIKKDALSLLAALNTAVKLGRSLLAVNINSQREKKECPRPWSVMVLHQLVYRVL